MYLKAYGILLKPIQKRVLKLNEKTGVPEKEKPILTQHKVSQIGREFLNLSCNLFLQDQIDIFGRLTLS